MSHDQDSGSTDARRRVTVPMIRQRKGGKALSVVTAYDATFARLFDDAGVDAILVGDSLGMVIQGHDSTLPVTLDEMVYHSRAVARGIRYAHLVVDMPFLSWQTSTADALRNAGRLLAEGGAHAVKLEGGEEATETVARIVQAGIPVMAHVGLTPQSVHAMGGFKVQGKDRKNSLRILNDARALAQAGAYSLVLEGIPSELARQITQAIEIPTIGIGAGPDCDGQVLVGYDLLGLSPGHRPKFVKQYTSFYERGVAAVQQYMSEVQSHAFPAEEHCYHGDEELGESGIYANPPIALHSAKRKSR